MLTLITTMTVELQGRSGGGNCTVMGYEVDLNEACPNELKITSSGGDGREGVACKSTCDACRDPQ